ncbi:MAG: hypothetical protein HC871_08960 [Rhizobiales bacterium]|nr:hypothetical protein [Hyphomicrobiales bacterium]
MLDFLEYEEKVGRFWHRLVGETASFSRFDDAVVSFATVKGSLPVFFRALGGDAGLELVETGARDSGHRLGCVSGSAWNGNAWIAPSATRRASCCPEPSPAFPSAI